MLIHEKRVGEHLTERGGLFLRAFGDDDEKEVAIILEIRARVLDHTLFGMTFATRCVQGHPRAETLRVYPSLQKAFKLLARQMGENFQVTEEMLKFKARKYEDSDEAAMEWLLSWLGGTPTLTEQAVELAMGRMTGALSMMKLFVEKRGDAVPVSIAALNMAASSGDQQLLRFVQDLLLNEQPFHQGAMWDVADGCALPRRSRTMASRRSRTMASRRPRTVASRQYKSLRRSYSRRRKSPARGGGESQPTGQGGGEGRRKGQRLSEVIRDSKALGAIHFRKRR